MTETKANQNRRRCDYKFELYDEITKEIVDNFFVKNSLTMFDIEEILKRVEQRCRFIPLAQPIQQDQSL